MLSKKASILLGRLLEQKMRKQSAYTRKKKLNEEGEYSGSGQGDQISLMATHFLLGAFGHNIQKAVFKKDENGQDVLDEAGNRITEYKSLDQIDDEDEIDINSPVQAISQVKEKKQVRVYYGPDMRTWMAQAQHLYSMLLNEENANNAEKVKAIKELFRAKFTAPKDTESELWLSPSLASEAIQKTFLTPTNDVMTPEARQEFLVGAEKLKKVYHQKFGSHGNTNAYYIDEKKFNPEIFTLAPEPELDEKGVPKVDPETGREIPKKVWGSDRNLTNVSMVRKVTRKGTTNFKSIQHQARLYKQMNLEEVINHFYQETEGYKKEREGTKTRETKEEVLKVQKELSEIPASLPQLKNEEIEKQLKNDLVKEFLKKETSIKVYTFNGNNYNYDQVEALSQLPVAARKEKEDLCTWAENQVSTVKTKLDAELKNKIGPAVSEKMREMGFQNLGRFGLKMSDGKLYINFESRYVVPTEEVKNKIDAIANIRKQKNFLNTLVKKEYSSLIDFVPEKTIDKLKGLVAKFKKLVTETEGDLVLTEIESLINENTDKYIERVQKFVNQFKFYKIAEAQKIKLPTSLVGLIENESGDEIGKFVSEKLPNLLFAAVGGTKRKVSDKVFFNASKYMEEELTTALASLNEETEIELTLLYPGTVDQAYQAYLTKVKQLLNPSIKTANFTSQEIEQSHKSLIYLFNYIDSQEDRLGVAGKSPILKKEQSLELKEVRDQISQLAKQKEALQRSGRATSQDIEQALSIAQRKEKKIIEDLGIKEKNTGSFLLDGLMSPRTKNGTKSTVSPYGAVGFEMSSKLASSPNFLAFVALITKGIKTAMFNILGTSKYYAYLVNSDKNLIENKEEEFLKAVLTNSNFELEKKRLLDEDGLAIITTLNSISKVEKGQTVYPFTMVSPKVKQDIVNILKETEPEHFLSIQPRIDQILDENGIILKGGSLNIVKNIVKKNYTPTEIDSATVTTYLTIPDEIQSTYDDDKTYSSLDKAVSSEWRSSLAEDQPEDEVEQRLLEKNKKRDYLKVAKKLYEVPVFKDFMDMIDFDTVFTNKEMETSIYTISTSPLSEKNLKESFNKVKQATLDAYQIYLDVGFVAEEGKMIFDLGEAEIDKATLNQLDFNEIMDIANTIKKDQVYLTDKRLTLSGHIIDENLDIIDENLEGAKAYTLNETKEKSKISATLNLRRRVANEKEVIGFIVIYYLIVKGAIDFDIKLNLKTINNALVNLVSNRKRQILDSLKTEEGEKLFIEELKKEYSVEGKESLIKFLSETLLKKDVNKAKIASLFAKVAGDKPFDIYTSFQQIFGDHIKSTGGKSSTKLTLKRTHLDGKALEKIGPSNYLELCEKIIGPGSTGVIGDSLKVEMAREKAQKEIEKEIKKDIQENFNYLLKGDTTLLDKLFENGLFNVTANLPLLTHTIVMKAYCLLLALDFSNGKKYNLEVLFSSGKQWWQIFNFKGLPKTSLYTSMINFYKNHFKILDKMLSGQQELKKEEEYYIHTQRAFGKPVEKLDIFIESDAEADEEKTAKFKNDFEKEAYNFAENNLDKLKAILSELKSDDEGESPIVSDNEAKLYFVDQLNKQLAQGDLIPIIDKSRELNALHNIYNWEREAKSGGEYINPETGDYSARTKQFIEKYRTIKGMSTSEISSRINSNIQSRQEIKNFLFWERDLLIMEEREIEPSSRKEEKIKAIFLFNILKQDVPMDPSGSGEILSNEQIFDIIDRAQLYISSAYMKQYINRKKIALQGYEQELSSNRIKEVQAMLDSAKSMYKTVSEELFKALDDVENPTMKQILGDFLKSLNPSLPL